MKPNDDLLLIELQTERDTLKKENEKSRKVIGSLLLWSHTHGSDLCPNGYVDTFGEGMRAAKNQVLLILQDNIHNLPQ